MAFSDHGVAVTLRYNTPGMMFRYTRRIGLALVVIAASCARNAPVPPPRTVILPDWGQVTKTSNCVVMNGALPDFRLYARQHQSGAYEGKRIGKTNAVFHRWPIREYRERSDGIADSGR